MRRYERSRAGSIAGVALLVRGQTVDELDLKDTGAVEDDPDASSETVAVGGGKVALEAEHDAGALETPLGDGVFADFGGRTTSGEAKARRRVS